MKALLSGQAAIAILIDNEHFYSLELGELGNVTERQEWEVPLLFEDATDIQQIDDATEATIRENLQLAWEKDRALQLILIFLDSQETMEIRFSAAECVNDFLNSAAVNEYIANRLYSAPLPRNADISLAIRLSTEAGLERVATFLKNLESDQEEIASRYQAWLDLPMDLFGNPSEKSAFYFDAVRLGAFRVFVEQREKRNLALIELLSHPYFRGDSKARQVFQRWAKPFQESATDIKFENVTAEPKFLDAVKSGDRKQKRSVKPHEAFQQAEKQRDTIKKLLVEGDQEKALRFAEQLVANQRRTSDPEHIAKSLCDLAQFVKKLGSAELQLEFAKIAVAEAPEDAFAYAVLGDAYRTLHDYQEALRAYHNAGVFGNVGAAALGRAEVLKDLGQLEDSLTLFESCIEQFPNDIVVHRARAAALADIGNFREALKAYDQVLEIWPSDPITLGGRAQVLRNMGKFEEALLEFEELVRDFPEDHITQHARAETLRDLGRLEEAKKTFAHLIERFPLAAGMRASYAKIVRDLGEFHVAIDQYKLVIKSHPLSLMGYAGLADTYRKIGDFKPALKIYDDLIERFPRQGVGKFGKACIFIAESKYVDALKLLSPYPPATLSEWIGYHIRGMANMRSGKFERAERIFERGLKENPWVSQRQYFQTALASLRIQQSRYEESIELVKGVSNPEVSSIAQAITMHACGALGDTSGFEKAYQAISEKSAPVVVSLRDVLVSKYNRSVRTPRDGSDDQIFLQECDSLLMAA